MLDEIVSPQKKLPHFPRQPLPPTVVTPAVTPTASNRRQLLRLLPPTATAVDGRCQVSPPLPWPSRPPPPTASDSRYLGSHLEALLRLPLREACSLVSFCYYWLPFVGDCVKFEKCIWWLCTIMLEFVSFVYWISLMLFKLSHCFNWTRLKFLWLW